MNIKVEGGKKGGREGERQKEKNKEIKKERKMARKKGGGRERKEERRNVRCHWRASHENLCTYKWNKTKETKKKKANTVEELIHLA